MSLGLVNLAIKPVTIFRGFIVANILGPADYGILKSIDLIQKLNKYGNLGFNYTAKREDVINMKVGLNNVPRLVETNGHTYAGVGFWSAPDTFTIKYEVVGYSTQDQWNLTFTKDGITVEEVNEITGVKTYSGAAIK